MTTTARDDSHSRDQADEQRREAVRAALDPHGILKLGKVVCACSPRTSLDLDAAVDPLAGSDTPQRRHDSRPGCGSSPDEGGTHRGP